MLRSLTERRPVGCLRVPRTRRLGAYPRKAPLPKCFGDNACSAWARAREVQWRLRSAAMLPQEPQCLAAPCAASSAWWCAAREARGLPGAPRGVPPGRPGHHPGWFLWDERTRGPDADRADTLSGQAATGSYDNTRLALAREPQPLWSYWEDKLAVSTVV